MYIYVILILIIVCSAFLYVNIKTIINARNKKIERFTEKGGNNEKENNKKTDEESTNDPSKEDSGKPLINNNTTEIDIDEKEAPIEMEFSNNNVEVKKSCMGDRGAFATKDIRKGETVEICPVILEKRENIKNNTEVDNYVFSSGKKGEVALAFGYCSLFNHDDDYNVEWQVDPNSKKIVLRASKDIKKGDEMFISYGKKYWSARNKSAMSCNKDKNNT